jgi:FKBP-type peptidyl-prolyl cis-trans isomerase 2
MQIAKNTVVTLDYELFDADGNLIERTDAPI